MRKKLSPEIRKLLENSYKIFGRSMFVILGDRGKDQIINLFNLWVAVNKQSNPEFDVAAKPEVLWAYKSELGFSSHQQKRKKEISKLMKQGLYEKETENPFENFLSKSQIRYCYYHDSHKILGSTFDILILQDFEALTPNILCRTIETVKGNGVVFLLLKQMSSLKQLHSLKMDVHKRYVTRGFDKIYPR